MQFSENCKCGRRGTDNARSTSVSSGGVVNPATHRRIEGAARVKNTADCKQKKHTMVGNAIHPSKNNNYNTTVPTGLLIHEYRNRRHGTELIGGYGRPQQDAENLRHQIIID